MADEKGDHIPNHDDSITEHDPHYEPIITLPEVSVSTMEEDEVEMIKLRAKLFRYDKSEDPAEWKERGTGDVKLLRHTVKNCVRVVMRRDKTLKLCANHYVTPWMQLKPSMGSDRAWVYSVDGDYADGEIRRELLAIRFANSENAKKWYDKFEEARMIVVTKCELYTKNGSGGMYDDDIDGSDSDEYEDSEGEGTAKTDEVKNVAEGETTKELEGKEIEEEKKKAEEEAEEEKFVAELEKLNVEETSNVEEKSNLEKKSNVEEKPATEGTAD